MKDRADYARKGIARGRSLVALECGRRDRHRRREPVPHAVQDQRDLRPHRVRGRRQVQRVRELQDRRRPPRRPQGVPYSREDVDRERARQRVRPDARPGVHARDEAVRGRDPGRPGRRRPPADDELFHILYDGTVMDEESFTVLGGQAETIAEALGSRYEAGLDLGAAVEARRVGARRRRRDSALRAEQLEVGAARPGPAAPHVPPHQGRRARSPCSARSARSRVSRTPARTRPPAPARPRPAPRARPSAPPAPGRGYRPTPGALAIAASTSPASITSRASSIWSSGTKTSTRAISPTVKA